MLLFSTFLLVLINLGLVCKSDGELHLSIVRSTEGYETPVSNIVGEKVGSNFSLICELLSTDNDTESDDHISWGKKAGDLQFQSVEDLKAMAQAQSKSLLVFSNQSEINKSVKRFNPLIREDEGTYFCMSLKYTLFKIVLLFVKNDPPKLPESVKVFMNISSHNSLFGYKRYPENMFCNDKMFKCMSNGACINQHYVCDGKSDCSDGSDEYADKCNGDPCKDKLRCEDGRCIPTSWCCDRHHDPNCTVRNRPTCCQLLSESYDEIEYGYVEPYKIKHIKSNGTRYLFITICVLSTFLSIVLFLLILSKVFLYAKKTAHACSHVRRSHLHLHEVPLRHLHGNDFPDVVTRTANFQYHLPPFRYVTSAGRANRYNGSVGHHNEATDPLLVSYSGGRDAGRGLVSLRDQPPPYSEVVVCRAAVVPGSAAVSQIDQIMGPPPPYSSREFLNIDRLSENRNREERLGVI